MKKTQQNKSPSFIESIDEEKQSENQPTSQDAIPPVVSVVVIAFNQEKYIAECLEGILAQEGDFKIELIIGDDCSTDDTMKIIKEYTDSISYNKIEAKILTAEKNIGMTKNLQRCFNACEGSYIAVCEGDDYWIDPKKLKKQINFLKLHPECALCFNDIYLFFQERGELVKYDLQQQLDADVITTEALVTDYYIGNLSCCMYDARFKEMIPSSLYNLYIGDWMFNIYYSQFGQIGHIKEIMSVYRKHLKGAWAGSTELENLYKLLPIIDSYNNFLDYKYNDLFLKYKEKITLSIKSIELNKQPSDPRSIKMLISSNVSKLRKLGASISSMVTILSLRINKIISSIWKMVKWAFRPFVRKGQRFVAILQRQRQLIYQGIIRERRELLTKRVDLLILDTLFPHPLSPFRYQEFISYLDYFQYTLVLTTGEHLPTPALKETRKAGEVIHEFEIEHPEYRGKTIIATHDIGEYKARLAYIIFLYNVSVFLPALEIKKIPFVFTLYPGGGFRLNVADSDRMLKQVTTSPCFRKVIVTQRITYDYLIEKNFCKPEQIELIYGVVTPLSLFRNFPEKKHYGFEKDTLDICFVSHKYMQTGIDKGYDIFIETARKLVSTHDNILFHVVGDFTEADLSIRGLEGRITFYGPRKNKWLEDFYIDKDIILSPNIPFKVLEGSFDGFPTASCTEAGLRKVAVFCTDELHLNMKFTNGEDIVIIPHESGSIAELVEFYYSNPTKLRMLAEKGSVKIRNIYSYENQILPRIKLLEAEMRKSVDLSMIYKQPLDIAVLDDIFPHPLSAFRMQEFTSYLKEFEALEIYSSGASVSLLGERTFTDVIAEFKLKYPLYAERIRILTADSIINARLIYAVFLINVYLNIEKIEAQKAPFVFTLYPGGGFGLNVDDSDRMLRRVMSSPCFRKVIVTQKVTYDYLIDNHYCKPDQIIFIFGVVTPLDQINAEYTEKKHFEIDKKTLDICFVAYKYTKKGVDKGYDIFIDVARQLCRNYDNIKFHVVGGIDKHEISVNDLKGKIYFYGKKDIEWFDAFYKDKDIILSPNIPGTMYPGSFDGFPTGSCVDAGLRKTAIFCTDELGLNAKAFSQGKEFVEGEEIVIIPHDATQITSIIEGYYHNPEKLKAISENGSLRIKQLYSYNAQILPRIKLLKNEIEQAEGSKKTIIEAIESTKDANKSSINTSSKSARKYNIFSVESLANLFTRVAEPEQASNEIMRDRTWKIPMLLSRILVRLVPPYSTRSKVLQRLYNNSFIRFKNFFRNRKDMRDVALIRSSELFDETWYLTRNPDVVQAKVDPVLHYWLYGGIEGRDPGPHFSSQGYLDTYEDVKKAGVNPLVHYLRHGIDEGRITQPQHLKGELHQGLVTQSLQSEFKVPLFRCPVCQEKIEAFAPLSLYYEKNWEKYGFLYKSADFETLNWSQYSCPKCGASDRDRLSALYLTHMIDQDLSGNPIKILDIAPAYALRQFLLKYPQLKYQSADKNMKDVDFAVDITDMNTIAQESYDFFICSHVLEHVIDDHKALSELFRILKPGGSGILMVPINLRIDKIREDPTNTDIGERWRKFGQDDHIRLYSKTGFIKRVEEAGFTINQYGVNFFGSDSFFLHGISPKSILYIRGEEMIHAIRVNENQTVKVKIVIWGASGHAMVIADIIQLRGEYQIIGFLDNVNLKRHSSLFLGLPILGGEEQLDRIREQGVDYLILGFGNCDARLKLADLIKMKGFQLAFAIHPSAIIASDTTIKPGSVVAAGAVINSGSLIGENVIINTSASVDHECIIGDGAHICPGVHLGGNVSVGRAAWVGIGSCVKDHISIGSGSLIGAGSVVVKDIPDNMVAYGNPARVIKQVNRDETI